MARFFNRAILGVALAVYAWTMMGVELYLRAAPLPQGPDRGLALFRRLVMGRATIALGAVSVLAAVVLAVLGRRERAPAVLALALGAAWVACLCFLWPI
jgi:hypothetical protein